MTVPDEGSPYASVNDDWNLIEDFLAGNEVDSEMDVWRAVARLRAQVKQLEKAQDWLANDAAEFNIRAEAAEARIKQLEGELEDEHRAIERAWAERNAETEKAVTAEAQVKQLEGERDEREAGAQWQYEMGKGWKERAEAAERENERLRKALVQIVEGRANERFDLWARDVARAALAARTEEPR